nr:Pholiota aurivella agglutinin, PAA, lectin [Pholiota aurivella, Peptide Partial, 16 aa] [Pholiota aurivella]
YSVTTPNSVKGGTNQG